MAGSAGKSESSSQATNQFDQSVFEPQANALEGLYGAAGNLFGGAKGGMAGQNQMGINNQNNAIQSMQNPWQNQMQGGAFSGMDLTGQMNQSLQNMQNRGPSNMQDINAMIMGGEGNNYADAMKASYVSDANRAGENMLSNLDARASASGMSGGARQGVATGRGFEDINRNLQRNLAETGFGAFDKDLDRKLSIAQQADTNNLARDTQNQNTLFNMMGGQQGAMQGGLNFGNNMFGFGQQQQMQPWQQLGAYSNAIGSPTVLGSGSGISSGDSKGFNVAGGGGK